VSLSTFIVKSPLLCAKAHIRVRAIAERHHPLEATMMSEHRSGLSRNHILATLPGDVAARLASRLDHVALQTGDVLAEPNRPISDVYFPLTMVASMLTVMRDGSSVETGSIGNEGFVGLPIFLGVGSMPARTFTQVPGEAVRMPADAFRAELAATRPFADTVARYVQSFFNQVAQSAACNRLHAVDERCARWLLMTHDRVGRDDFILTQEFLSQMLGVRRSGVTVAAATLQHAGFIRYRRGRITMLDREGLEAASCECYEIMKHERDRWGGISADVPRHNGPNPGIRRR
jgi:CRP-like cAMP-binding protein